MTPWLTQDEIDELCMPLKQHAAQIRFLRRLGVEVRPKPNGAALVMRSHFELAMQPKQAIKKPAKNLPNREGLRLAFARP